MHQDKVRIIIRNDKKEGKRQEGVVVKVLERGMPEIVGTYQLNRDFGFVISDNPKFSKDIFIPRKEAAGIKNGDKVIVVITDYGSGNKNPEGKIKENLGNIRTPGTEAGSACSGSCAGCRQRWKTGSETSADSHY